MRKIIATILITLIILQYSAVYALADTPSPELTPTATPSAAVSPDGQNPTDTPPADLLQMQSQGIDVVRLQWRLMDLGFFGLFPTGTFSSITRQAVVDFQVANGIMSDGTVGNQTKQIIFNNNVNRAAIPQGVKILSGPALTGTPAISGELLEWSEVDALLKPDVSVKCTDYNTGKAFSVKRVGGTGHAEVMPASSLDKTAILELYVDERNWEKRAVVVELNGKKIAASYLFCTDSNLAEPEKQGCLYFSGSTSHVFGIPDVEHEKMVNKATVK